MLTGAKLGAGNAGKRSWPEADRAAVPGAIWPILPPAGRARPPGVSPAL